MTIAKPCSVYLASWFLSVAFLLACQLAVGEANAQSRSPIRRIDFRNRTYPSFWSKNPIKLRDGKLKREEEHCISHFSLERVDYLDLTGDGREEALLNVTDWTACGSSGFSHYYYIYAIRNNKPCLLWRFSTGSEGICGQKDFRLEKRDLVLELFGDCRVGGIRFRGGGVECCPTEYSRIRVAWDGQRFRQKSAKVHAYMAK